MKVEIIVRETLASYEELATEHGSAFNSKEWLSILEPYIQRYGIFDDNGKLTGGFVMQLKKYPGIRFFRNPPYMPNNALFFKVLSENPSTINHQLKKVQEAIHGYFRHHRPALVNLAFPMKYIDFQSFIWNKYKVVPRYSYVLSLLQSSEVLWLQMAGERRNDIKKAEKDGVRTVLNDKEEIVFQLILQSYKRNKVEADAAMVQSILRGMISLGKSYSFTSYLDDLPLATAFCIFDKDTSFYILGGYDEKNRHKGAGALALYKCILHAREMGLQTFDFEGSMIPAIEKYFRAFGGEIKPYFTINKAPFLLECLLKLIKRHEF